MQCFSIYFQDIIQEMFNWSGREIGEKTTFMGNQPIVGCLRNRIEGAFVSGVETNIFDEIFLRIERESFRSVKMRTQSA